MSDDKITAEWCEANGAEIDSLGATWMFSDVVYVQAYPKFETVYIGMRDEDDYIPLRSIKTASQLRQLLDLLGANKP